MFFLSTWMPVVHVLFFVLLAGGWYTGNLNWRRLAAFLAIWVAGSLLLPRLAQGLLLFGGLVAVLDIVLVLKVLKRDIPLD